MNNVEIKQMVLAAVESIYKFNELGGNKQNDPELEKAYVEYINEESFETFCASYDIVEHEMISEEFLDGIGDTFVVCTGLLYALGFSKEYVTTYVTSTAPADDFSDGVEAILSSKSKISIAMRTIQLMALCIKTFSPEIFEKIITEINNSNLSKFCKNEQEAEDSVKAYDSSTEYSAVHHVRKGDWYVIRGYTREGSLKILKSINFKKPDLSEVANEINEI